MKKKVVIIGGFHKAKSLASSLIRKDYDVTVINADYKHCKLLSEIPKLHVVYGNGTKPYVLEDAEINNMDIAIALSHQDDVNLISCELCKKMFHVKQTVAIVSDIGKSRFFYDMGVDRVVCATDMIVREIEQQAFIDNIAITIPFSNDDIVINEIKIPDNSPVAGKCLHEIDLPQNAVIGCIFRDSHSIIPKGDTQIHGQDFVVLIVHRNDEKEATQVLTGK